MLRLRGQSCAYPASRLDAFIYALGRIRFGTPRRIIGEPLSLMMNHETETETETSELKSTLERACERNANYIRSNPVSTVLGALAAGLVVGWLLPHRRETWAERYVSGPADRMKGWFVSAADDVAQNAHAVQDRAADLASHAAKAVSQGIKKFRFW